MDFKKGALSAERIHDLQSLPGWRWSVAPGPHDFAAIVRLLKAFAARHGHAQVPETHRVGRVALGLWVVARRCNHRRGRLPHVRRRALEAVPGWTWDPIRERFERAIGLLRAFARREGHARVPRGHVERGFALGDWVASRRMENRRKKLSSEQIRALESVPGWSWDPRRDSFEHGLHMLRRFVRRESHARIPQWHVEAGFRLGKWVQHCRAKQENGTLTMDQAHALTALPGWSWRSRHDRLATALSLLRRFAARTGHTRVPVVHVERGFPVGRWVANQRSAKTQGRLSARRIRAIAAVPHWTWRSGNRRSRAGSHDKRDTRA